MKNRVKNCKETEDKNEKNFGFVRFANGKDGLGFIGGDVMVLVIRRK